MTEGGSSLIDFDFGETSGPQQQQQQLDGNAFVNGNDLLPADDPFARDDPFGLSNAAAIAFDSAADLDWFGAQPAAACQTQVDVDNPFLDHHIPGDVPSDHDKQTAVDQQHTDQTVLPNHQWLELGNGGDAFADGHDSDDKTFLTNFANANDDLLTFAAASNPPQAGDIETPNVMASSADVEHVILDALPDSKPTEDEVQTQPEVVASPVVDLTTQVESSQPNGFEPGPNRVEKSWDLDMRDVRSTFEYSNANPSADADGDSSRSRRSAALINREARRAAANTTARFGERSDIDACCVCGKRVYPLERATIAGRLYHKLCARCTKCNRQLDSATYHLVDSKLYCKAHQDEAIRAAASVQHYVRALAQNATTAGVGRTSEAPKVRKADGSDRDVKQSDGIVNANANLTELANELAECRKAADLKSVRSRFEVAAASKGDAPAPQPRPARISSNTAPRRAVSMHNVNAGGELSLSLPNGTAPELVSSSQNGVADELALCRQRAVTKQNIGRFVESVSNGDLAVSGETSDAASAKRGDEDLPSNGLARKMAALFQSANADGADADGEVDGILV